jgi:hypothetical protein
MWCLFALPQTVFARVNRDIQKAFEKSYEDKVYILKQDLILYEDETRRIEFYTDMTSFIYPGFKPGYTEKYAYKKGDRVFLEELDFYKDTITISFSKVDTREDARLTFQFDDRLSTSFYEKSAFVKRFEEIFSPDLLKEVSDFTDTISTLIDSQKIQIGDSRQDLLLTLGKPSDIVRRVTATSSMEEWFYRRGNVFYQFFFENDELTEWVAHQER